MRQPDLWLVTTASGARHLIDSRCPTDVTVTRLRVAGDAPPSTSPFSALRRDGRAVQLSAISHLLEGHLRAGVLVGVDMYLTLEPLSSDASLTVRRTTPVVSITTAREEVRGD